MVSYSEILCSSHNGEALNDTYFLHAIFDRNLPEETYLNIMKVKMWEYGHSFAEINAMTLYEMGIVLGYWSEQNRIKEMQSKEKT